MRAMIDIREHLDDDVLEAAVNERQDALNRIYTLIGHLNGELAYLTAVKNSRETLRQLDANPPEITLAELSAV